MFVMFWHVVRHFVVLVGGGELDTTRRGPVTPDRRIERVRLWIGRPMARATCLGHSVKPSGLPRSRHCFLTSLVQHLAKALQVRGVYVAECLDEERARSRAIWPS